MYIIYILFKGNLDFFFSFYVNIVLLAKNYINISQEIDSLLENNYFLDLNLENLFRNFY